jgi:hypothetical protein
MLWRQSLRVQLCESEILTTDEQLDTRLLELLEHWNIRIRDSKPCLEFNGASQHPLARMLHCFGSFGDEPGDRIGLRDVDRMTA